jgi:two-component system, LytTR family, sensor kinase
MKKSNYWSIFLRPTLYYHALYWTANVLFFALIFWSTNNYKDFLNNLHENFAFLPMGMVFTYFSVNYLIPKYFFNNRIPLYIVLQVLVLLLYPVISNAVVTLYISPVIHKTHISYSPYNGFLTIILILIFDIVPLAGVKILNQFKQDALLRQKTEYDKIQTEFKLREAELKLLKGQIHPHFLFNTLNNLYSLSLVKSDKAPDLLIRLADMLSYIIYDCNSEKVPLAKEIGFIDSFLELQKLRYDTCNISYKLNGEFNGSEIAPMILHTFIDNGFKHGASTDSGSPWMKIAITSKDELLFFSIINSTSPGEGENKKTAGIGIENVRRRLRLIYPDRHDLVINNSGTRYSVFLKLEL